MRRLLTALLMVLSFASVAHSNSFYTHGSFPTTGSAATSAAMRAELDLISAGFDKLPTLIGNAGKIVVINGAETALSVSTGTLSLGGDFTLSGAFATTFTVTGITSVIFPTTGTLATLAGVESLSNKTFSSPVFGGTVSGTYTLAGTPTLTSPTITSPTITGGTMTAPTITAPAFSGAATGALSGLALTSPVVTTGTVAADPTTALGIASKQYVDALWTTGDAKLTLKTTADSGWVLVNDGTIGNGSSGGTTRANADTSALFALLWTNCANANCAVSTGRGGSAAADFAANKTIALPKSLGRAIAIAGTGSGLTARALGSVFGEEAHALTTPELAAHSHNVTDPGHAHLERGGQNGGGGGANVGAVDTGTNAVTSSDTASATTGISIQSAGSGSAHNVMQPTVFLNVMIKL